MIHGRVTVTFEYENRSADTTVVAEIATTPATVIARAVRRAQKELNPRGWTSLVAVVERMAPLVRHADAVVVSAPAVVPDAEQQPAASGVVA